MTIEWEIKKQEALMEVWNILEDKSIDYQDGFYAGCQYIFDLAAELVKMDGVIRDDYK